ncbi:MAG: DNA processing protein [Rhodothermales bacterium]
MTERDAYIVLNLMPGIGPVKVRQLLTVFGKPQAILEASPPQLRQGTGLSAKQAEVLGNWRLHVNLDRELEAAHAAGVEIVPACSPYYPERLREIYDPPLCLYVRGNPAVLGELANRSLAVVGSRRMTRYGQEMTERLTMAASRAGWIIVSGLAHGVDTIAHSTTLKYDGTTVAVLGSGLACIYPEQNIGLARAISEKGAVISELPMNTSPDRRWFPMRNRIIAGMSQGTLVVEAGIKSGSLITAQQALDNGRPVFAVPGQVSSPNARGCHSLIKQGAKLVESLEDISQEFEFLPELLGELPGLRPAPAPKVRPNFPELTPNEAAIAKQLLAGEASAEQLADGAQLAIHEALASLLTLEIKQIIVQLPGKRFRIKSQSK